MPILKGQKGERNRADVIGNAVNVVRTAMEEMLESSRHAVTLSRPWG